MTGKRVEIPFTKMHGLGNDYIYIDRFSYTAEHHWPSVARAVSDRHFGIGSDGLILIEPSDTCDFRMRMFNADGSEGDMCGNGMRCLAKYVFDRGLTTSTEFTVETKAGVIRPHIVLKNGAVYLVSVDMGEPKFTRSSIPLARLDGPEPAVDEPVEVDGHMFYGTALSMGNPHYVIFVDNLGDVDVVSVGPRLEKHPAFPARANIEFAVIRGPNRIDMQVWERGSGVTLACGTGAGAVVVAAALKGKAEKGRPVEVNLPGGTLVVEWRNDNHVWQTGPAVEICSGRFYYHETCQEGG